MAFKKGISGNLNGRPKGSENKITTETKEIIKNFIDSEIKNIIAEFKELTIKERFDIITKLLPYVMPKIETVSIHEEEEEDQTVSFKFVEVN
jgi:hypothetical protein